MYAAIRQYEMGSGFVADLMPILDEGFANVLRGQSGFIGYYAIASGSDEIATVTLFDDEESAVRSNEIAAQFVRDRLGEFELELTSQMSGEVGVSRVEAESVKAQQE
jgi:hypothetical protein